jgi:hypothetical protein
MPACLPSTRIPAGSQSSTDEIGLSAQLATDGAERARLLAADLTAIHT